MTSLAAGVRRFVEGAGTFRRLPIRVQVVLAHAGLVFAVVELVVRHVRIERLAHSLGISIDMEPARSTDEVLPVETLPLDARRRLRCAQRIAQVWPFADGTCLRLALVGGHLLRHLDPTIRIGVMRDDDPSVSAHAWLEIDGKPLEDVAPFTRFEHRPASERRPSTSVTR